MTANCRRIHRMAGVVSHRVGERRGDDLPDPSLAPSSEALIDSHPLAVLVREIAPRRPAGGSCGRAPAQQALQQPPFRFAQISRIKTAPSNLQS